MAHATGRLVQAFTWEAKLTSFDCIDIYERVQHVIVLVAASFMVQNGKSRVEGDGLCHVQWAYSS